MRRRRTLREDEQALWTAFVRDIKPLARKAAAGNPAGAPEPAPVPDVVPSPVRGRRAAPLAAGSPQPAPLQPRVPAYTLHRSQASVEIGERRPGLDDTSWRALVSGKLRPTRTLDLHGQNVQAAFQRLHAFLVQARADNLRCVEVITGLGSGRQGGVLRRELPFWLGRPDLRPLILAVTHPHAANQGSVRILLRRRG
ncbi:Smr protein/MutS2 [Gluconacetobacter diazotrophicus PA1 5]|uniref:Smr/MutS family protein n=1 Tax=Gluconacetobacter diazotrophicus TaxID=33996 RepID=UPI000173CA55|nr:Smr/MutS family protein [Gluconacetobacter diazotrophicus]ACI50081.1 Smr protein/MutS2 [Gluconacetobacter diazotrophicus PA1 5]TWB07839.1 DNA-nicking Smr family endonuclease [Gluconacetobacter diazotrophicus]